jgi:fused signal recognition particle receptor
VFKEEVGRLLGNKPEPLRWASQGPTVILIVGVNGAGKTTTIGKLAAQFKIQGKKVFVGAADTFRAAAIEQLEVWANRAGVELVKHKEGADPAAVAFDTVKAGNARHADVILIDTAGRLHTKTNLMEELKKVRRVIQKEIPEAPHETLLVIDAVTGQNALHQAKVFKDAVELSGIILTKLDGSAKGGAILSIRQELGIPIKFIGVGEAAEDLQPFDPVAFAQALLGETGKE